MVKRILPIMCVFLFAATGFAQEKAATTGQVKPEDIQVQESAKVPMVERMNPAAGQSTSSTVEAVSKINTKPIATSAKNSSGKQGFGKSAPHQSSKAESITPDKSTPTASKGAVNSKTTPVPEPVEASKKVN